MLLRASPETTWFDKKRTPTRCGKNQDKRLERTQIDQKTTRRGAASTKTNSERTQIDQKTMRMRYIQVQKKSRRSAHTSSEKIQTKCKQSGRGTSRTRGLETTRMNQKQLGRASRLSLHLYHEIRKNMLLRAILLRQVQKQPSLIKRKQPG